MPETSLRIVACMLALLSPGQGGAQVARDSVKPGAPPRDLIVTRAITHRTDGSIHRLRGAAMVETSEMLVVADEIDYDERNAYAEARGNVRVDFHEGGEHIEADRIEYDFGEQTARFWNVRGSSPARLTPRAGVLSTNSPFSFQGAWAERVGNRFLLHHGFVTNCRLPRPWWTLHARVFDVVPSRRAIIRHPVFRLKGVPLFYAPVFYRTLRKEQRHSGFLMPTIAANSRRGLILGWGYYWAINRSSDLTYRPRLFTERGWAHNAEFRGRPAANTDFTYSLYGVRDRGLTNSEGVRSAPASGYTMKIAGRSEDIGWGLRAYGEFNYLSSFRFRREFTEGFYDAIDNEVQSTAVLHKTWSAYSFALAATSVDAFGWPTAASFPGAAEDRRVSIRKLPSIEFRGRDRQVAGLGLPVWLSFESSAAFLSRTQDSLEDTQKPFNSTGFVSRYDLEPQLTTALRWKSLQLLPSFSIRQTRYGRSLDEEGRISEYGLHRKSHRVDAELVLPPLARMFGSPASRTRWKHVIEPRAFFRYAGGVGTDFERLIRFDQSELLSDTKEMEVSVTNRLYSKQGGGSSSEILTWRVSQRRYFDPTFGGAVRAGERNVLLSSVDLTAFAFVDGRRHYSPVASSMRSKVGVVGAEWRMDYDPLRGRAVNSFLGFDTRIRSDYYVSAGHSRIDSAAIYVEENTLKGLAPKINLLDLRGGYGQRNRPGFVTDFVMQYSYLDSVFTWAQMQVTYNTDCCGWSVQYRRVGYRNDNDLRFAFSIANVGSLGSLRGQDIY